MNENKLEGGFRHKVFKDLMLGLIYPAVLGNIIYILIDNLFGQLNQPSDFNVIRGIKFGLFLVTLAFYFADYLYIYFTREFQGKFFLCDLVFVSVLFFTIRYIDINRNDQLEYASPIFFCYWIFMGLYWYWDEVEKKKCESGVCIEGEIDFYERLIKWEKRCFGAILGFLIASIILNHFFNDKYLSNCLLLIVLFIITLQFWKFTIEKGKFFRQSDILKV